MKRAISVLIVGAILALAATAGADHRAAPVPAASIAKPCVAPMDTENGHSRGSITENPCKYRGAEGTELGRIAPGQGFLPDMAQPCGDSRYRAAAMAEESRPREVPVLTRRRRSS